jgi:hypothetical protein
MMCHKLHMHESGVKVIPNGLNLVKIQRSKMELYWPLSSPTFLFALPWWIVKTSSRWLNQGQGVMSTTPSVELSIWQCVVRHPSHVDTFLTIYLYILNLKSLFKICLYEESMVKTWVWDLQIITSILLKYLSLLLELVICCKNWNYQRSISGGLNHT